MPRICGAFHNSVWMSWNSPPAGLSDYVVSGNVSGRPMATEVAPGKKLRENTNNQKKNNLGF